MSCKKLITLSIIFVIVIVSSVIVIITKNRKPVYTDSQKKFIEIANDRLESLGYNYENKELKYEEFIAFEKKMVDLFELPECLKSVENVCVIDYAPKGKYSLGGVATVYIDMETATILHAHLGK